MKSKLVHKLLAGVITGVAAAVIVWLLANLILPDLFSSFEARTYDHRVTLDIQDVPSQSIDDIVIIDIDGRSESELGRFAQWPRSYFTQVVEYLDEGGAAIIGLDIIFVKDKRNPETDQEFVRAVANAGNVVNALYFEQEDSLSWRYKMMTPPQEFEWEKFARDLPTEYRELFPENDRIGNDFFKLLNAGYALGHVNFRGDIDGVVRKIHLFGNFLDHSYPSFAFRMFTTLTGVDKIDFEQKGLVRLFSEGQLVQEIPIDENGNMLINWAGNFQTFRFVSFYDVLKQRIPKEYFQDKVVLVGTSLPGLFDLRSAPFNPDFPGVEIHANILYTLLTGDFVQKTSSLQSFLIYAVAGIIVGIIIIFLSPLWSIIVVLVFSVINIFIAYNLHWEGNFWMPVINPMITLLVTFSLIYIYKYNTEEKGKRFIKETFSHFVTHSVVEELLANPEKIKLGGERKNCTVMFSDVAGFTTISEQLTPEALVKLLNDYLTEMTNIIFKYDGMLDKYEGDAIMAVFGAPLEHGNHAVQACAAALMMQTQLVKLRELWGKQNRPQLEARCGLNTGDMVVGNMGSETRFDYTVMGDAVNLGSRLEAANKEYGTSILIGVNTFTKAGDQIITRELDLLRVMGKNEPVRVYELVGLKEEGIPDKKQQVLDIFREGYENYRAKNWQNAKNYFDQVLAIDRTDGPSKTYINRCDKFIANPPAEDWDGVYTMLRKG
ncbi:MAG: adenylate/guanylate cyclase domain-containing protein [Calditrichia bacterium]|nr:adenylate/guanylate cyclase domain-containing protein [Calditrichia bacterium]